MADLHIPSLIAKKRDGRLLNRPEIEYLVDATTNGEMQQAQLGALLMAIYLKGMNIEETTNLTAAMMWSGEVLTWPEEWRDDVVDKHSTGGVGDKVSLPLAPALAACGLKVPMISGRGLGHTGGTLDKLESIPGFRVSHSKQGMQHILENVGCCIVGQTEQLVPADRLLYATRDVTATVGSQPLIAASIVSKKAAESLNCLVLDVKVGKGALFENVYEARKLARTMVEISKGVGMKTRAVLTEMSNPLGCMIGNSLEVKEAIQCMKGNGPEDLRELVAHLGGQILKLHNRVATVEDGEAIIASKLDNGAALECFEQMIVAQGVEPALAKQLCHDEFESVLPQAQYVTSLLSLESGYVDEIDSMACAQVSGALGAGRSRAGQDIDYSVGLELLIAPGCYLEQGKPWVLVHHNSVLDTLQIEQLQDAVKLTTDFPVHANRSRVIEIVS